MLFTNGHKAQMVDQCVNAFIGFDQSNKIVYWNRGATEIFGYTREEIIGTHYSILLPSGWDEGDEFAEIEKEIKQSGFVKDIETEGIAKDGRRIPLSLTMALLKNNRGSTIGSCAVAMDISRRKELEKGYQRRVIELSIINEITRVLQSKTNLEEILYIILIGVTARQGLGFNRAFLLLVDEEERLLEGKLAVGPSDATEVGKIWAELARKKLTLQDLFEDYKCSTDGRDIKVNELVKKFVIPLSDKSNALIRCMSECRPFRIVNERNNLMDGTDISSLLRNDTYAIVPLVFEDKPVGVLLVENLITKKPIDDHDLEILNIFAGQAAAALGSSILYEDLEEKVEQLKEAYRNLKENQERLIRAERLSAIGKMAAKVAHEIRTPLVAIGGYARSLLDEIQPDDPKISSLKIIVGEVMRLENMLKDILSYTRTEIPRLKMCDVNKIIEDALEVMKGEVDAERITIKHNLSPSLSLLPLDTDQMKQVLINMMHNAIHAMPEGGILSVSTTEKNGYIQVEISDTGCGIAEENLEKVFSAFFTTKSYGSGLGLTISSQIVRDHGGSIWARSEVEKGSTFYISFPIEEVKKNEGDTGCGGRRSFE